MSWSLAFFSIVPAFALSWALCAFIRRFANQFGFLDRPGAHKAHARPVPLGGGVAIFWAVAGPVLAGALYARFAAGAPPDWLPDIIKLHLSGIASKLPSLLAVIGGAFVLHVLGLYDDRKAMGPWSKLAVQVIVALFTAGPIGIRAVEALPVGLSVFATVLWIVVVTNAMNFLDNMDGLSAGVGAIAALLFALASASAGQIFVPALACVLGGVLIGYLCWNFAPASLFMGDAGSLPIGYLLSVLTILTTYYDPRQNLAPLGVFVPPMVLAVPLYDFISVVIYRLRLGISPFRGDRRHFSHRLVKRGMTPRGAVLTIYLATAATGLPAVVLPHIGDWRLASLLFAQCICVVLIIAILENTNQVSDA